MGNSNSVFSAPFRKKWIFKAECMAIHNPKRIKKAQLFTYISLIARYYTAGLALFLNKAEF